MSKRILVTGGAGFLGSHLCERLIKDGHEVICVDDLFTGSRRNLDQLLKHRRFEFVRHDVCQPMHIDCEQIYHLACPASPVHYQRNPVRTIRTCVQGTLNVLDLAREVDARVMIASTSEVYGDPLVHPQVETYWGNVNPIGIRACYDEGKRCAEALAASYAQQYDVGVRIARIFNSYGPRMLPNDGRVVSNFIVQCLRDEPITIFGDGAQTRSFCYVDDLIEGFVRLMASDERDPVNLGNPNEATILQLAERIRQMTGSGSTIVRQPLPQDDPTRRQPDITRARERLGWQPTIEIEAGLSATIDYFRSRLAAPDQIGS
jgi:UDP-glucuronate decarboxylase